MAKTAPVAADPAGVLSALEAFATADTNLRRRDEVYPQALADLIKAAEALDIDPDATIDDDLAALRAADEIPTPPLPLVVGDTLQLDVVLPDAAAIPIAAIALRLLRVQDLIERVKAAQDVGRAAVYRTDEAPDGASDWDRYELIRAQRDIACLVLLSPYMVVWRKEKQARVAAEHAYDRGEIDRDELARRHEEARTQFLADLREAERVTGLPRLYRPMAVARLVGVSRGLINERVMKREPADLTVSWSIEEAAARAMRCAAIVRRWEVLHRVAQEIRNQAVGDLLSGRNDTGANPDGTLLTNSDIQELLGVTSARASQLRRGGR